MKWLASFILLMALTTNILAFAASFTGSTSGTVVNAGASSGGGGGGACALPAELPCELGG